MAKNTRNDNQLEQKISSKQLFEAIENSRYGYKDEIKKFITKEALDSFNQDGWSPLHLVLQKGYVDQAQLLVDLGADKKAVSQNDQKYTSAAIVDKSNLIHKLIEDSDQDLDKGIVDLLINLGADLNNLDENGETALHFVFKQKEFGHRKINKATALINSGASINIPDNSGKTVYDVFNESLALICSVNDDLSDCYGSPQEAIIKLVSLGGNKNHINEDGWSLLHSAVQDGLLYHIQSLLELGAVDEISKNVEAKSVAQLFSEKNFLHAKNITLKSAYLTMKIGKALGVDCDRFDENGWTPLHLAVKRGNKDLAEALVKLGGADKDKISTNAEAQTPIDIAKENNLILDLNNKEVVILYAGPETSTLWEYEVGVGDPEQNLFHSDLLKKYFDVKKFFCFDRMVEFI